MASWLPGERSRCLTSRLFPHEQLSACGNVRFITARPVAAVARCGAAWMWQASPCGDSPPVRPTNCPPFSLLLPQLRACLPSCRCVRWRHPDPEAALYSAPVRGWTLGRAGFAGQCGWNWRGRSAFHSADAAPPPSCGRPVFTTPRLYDSKPTKDGDTLAPQPFWQLDTD